MKSLFLMISTLRMYLIYVSTISHVKCNASQKLTRSSNYTLLYAIKQILLLHSYNLKQYVRENIE